VTNKNVEDVEQYEQLITVLGTLDLSRMPNLSDEASITQMTKIKSCCAQGGTIGFKITLKKTGFLPGDDIEFDGEIYNYCVGAVFELINLQLVQVSRRFARDNSTTKFHYCINDASLPFYNRFVSVRPKTFPTLLM
jgi:hypothetical protein